jgi:predicted nuclease of predicted toxin-antitoxin system
MRLLIDECIDERLRLLFPGHDCQTARFAGFTGLTNGQLLDAAEAAGFEALVTVDQGIPEQQNIAGRRISVLILRAPTNRLRDLEAIVPAALSALQAIQPGEIVRTP